MRGHKVTNIFLSLCLFVLVSWCPCVLVYAEEQDIAESFGLYSKGIDYYHQGKLYEAKDILERAVKIDPRNDEAQGYLDLVNAEINMRKQGRLNSYQDMKSFKRETDLENKEQYNNNLEPQIQPSDNPENEEEAVAETTPTVKPANPKIRGEYKMSIGVTGEDLIWKQANGDYNERNFRMIDNNFPKANTFDTRVFDRFKVVFDTNPENNGLNLHSDITVDPWSFVGKTDKFTVTSNAGTDTVDLQLKYWAATGRTINEKFFTNKLGDSLPTSEYKINDGKIDPFNISSSWSTFSVPEQKVDFEFQPIRELWVDFKDENSHLRIFPFGLQDQALSSDDPLGLSNHHIYWEASPWLYDWIPGHINTGAVPNDFWRGEWSDSLASFTRDSDLTRLTALRGLSFQGDFFDNGNIAATIATPKTLWQDYDNVTALPGAVRLKSQITDGLMIGGVDAFRIGYAKDSVDSYNNVTGVDMKYDFDSTSNILGEVAVSKSENDRSTVYETAKDGSAGHIAFNKEAGMGKLKLAYTHMDKEFDPGLANYKQTRKDQFWGRHIHFKKPLEYGVWSNTTLKYDDIDPFRIGDGIDIGRDAVNFRLDKKNAFDKKMDNLIDFRYVRDSDHKFVESVAREENTYRINPEWTSKLLLLYQDLPKTKGGIDPILYDSVTGEYLKNTAVEDGKDPSLSTYSAGLEYAPEEWISFFGIFENTNDFTSATGDYPNGLLNSTYWNTEVIDGKVYRINVPQLYKQFYFATPPYDRFNIYRAGIFLKPAPGLGVELDYTKNDFKFSQSIDDNMNHFGAALSYEFNKKLTGFLKYTFSRAYNVYRLNTSGDLKYQGHHNVFMEMDYVVSENGLLVVQFGEGSVISPVLSATVSPFGDFYPTLDTQHILRIYYNGRF